MVTTWSDGDAFASGAGWSVPPDSDEVPWAPTEPEERYERRRLLGAGGMGRVYAVWDARLEREVALKEVAASVTGATSERLAAEARTTARLEHPGIVPVHDAGESGDGRLYYTMRLVQGRSMLACIAADDQGLNTLLRHFLAAAQAVAFAHSRGVVHRDLKPENIMVGAFGETQVVDWGLARPLDAPDGQAVGTPAYMAPEQAEGTSSLRSDVWSLGATLHHLLGGRPPFPGDSAAILVRSRAGRAEALDAAIAPDLRAIALRALSLDPEDRYPSAAELAEDLARFLDGRQVVSYSYSPWELLRRLLIAWRVPLTVALVGALLTSLVGAGAWRQTLRERDRAVAAEEQTAAALAVADEHLSRALETQALSAHREGRLADAEVLAAHALSRRESADMRGILAAAGPGERPRVLEEQALPDCPGLVLDPAAERFLCVTPDGVSLWELASLTRLWTRPDLGGGVVFAGDAVALARSDLSLLVLDAASGATRYEVQPTFGGTAPRSNGRFVSLGNGLGVLVVDVTDGRVHRAEHCEDAVIQTALGPGDELALACVDGTLRVGRVGQPLRTLPSPFDADEPSTGILVFDGSERLLAGTTRGRMALIDLTGAAAPALSRVFEEELRGLTPLPDAGRVAVLDAGGRTRLVNLRTGAVLGHLPGPLRRVLAVDGAPDQAVTFDGGRLRRWALPESLPPRSVRGPAGLTNVSVSPDGRRFAAASGDSRLRVYDAATGDLLHQERVGNGVMKWAAFSPDGRWLMGASMNGPQPVVLDTTTWRRVPLPTATPMRRIGALADGSIWGAAFGPALFLLRPGAEAWTPVTSGSAVHDGASTADGRWAAAVDGEGLLWWLESGAEPAITRLFSHPGAGAVAPHPSGERVAISDHEGVHVLDLQGEPLLDLRVTGSPIGDIAVSPDGRWLAGAQVDGLLRVWGLEDGREVAVLRGHEGRAASVVFDATSAELLSAGWDGQVLRWSVAALDRPADELRALVEEAWGMPLDEAL